MSDGNTSPGLPVHGYVAQPQGKIDLVNQNKMLEEACLRRIDDLRGLSVDARWCAMAKTHLELAFMCLNRAVVVPERVQGELDLDVGRKAG